MGFFDDDEAQVEERGVQAEPDASADVWKTVSETVEAVAERIEEAQLGRPGMQTDEEGLRQAAAAAAEAAEAVVRPPGPDISVEDDGTGGTRVTTSGAFGKGEVTSHGDGHVSGNVNYTAGPAGRLKAQVETDTEGDITKGAVDAKLSVGGVGAETKQSYEDTPDGWKASGSLGVEAPIEGVPTKAEVRGGYEDLGDRGYKATGGAGLGVKAEGGSGMVEGSAMAGVDVDLADVDDQQTVGVRDSITVTGEAAGQEIAEAKYEHGVAYTTGPQGEKFIEHAEVSGKGTAGGGTVSGRVRSQHEWGTDAQGNDIDRQTTTAEGAVKSDELGIDKKVSESWEFDPIQPGPPTPGQLFREGSGNTGIRWPGPTPAPQDVAFDMVNPDLKAGAGDGPDVPLDAINPDLKAGAADVPLDMVNPDLKTDGGDDDVPLDAVNPDLDTASGAPVDTASPDPGAAEAFDPILARRAAETQEVDEVAPTAWEETPGVSATEVESVETYDTNYPEEPSPEAASPDITYEAPME